MSQTISQQWILKHRPDGQPTSNDFEPQEVAIEPLAEGQLLIKNSWFSVDASMRKRLAGGESSYLKPYSIGQALDGWAVGEVVESRDSRFAQGDYVLHSAGWRDLAVVDAGSGEWGHPKIIDVNDDISPELYLGMLGPTGLTAWAGLIFVGELKENDVVYVSAAAGSIGILVARLAKRRGCRVIGSAGSDEKVRYLLDEVGLDGAFNYRTTSIDNGLRAEAPGGVDLYYDNVGGDHLESTLEHMNPGGRVVLCGAISDYDRLPDNRYGIKNLFIAIERGITLRGFLARMYQQHWAEFQQEMHALLLEGGAGLPMSVIEGLENAPQGLIDLLSGANLGKTVVKVDA